MKTKNKKQYIKTYIKFCIALLLFFLLLYVPILSILPSILLIPVYQIFDPSTTKWFGSSYFGIIPTTLGWYVVYAYILLLSALFTPIRISSKNKQNEN